MRVHAAYREDGQIVALAEIVEEGGERMGIRLMPGDDQKVAEFTVPADYADRPFAELVAHYRVEDAAEGPRLMRR